MRDAYGGVVSISIVVVFLVLVSGYLAFNVNYTKAFRLKNKVISVLEEYEGAGYDNIVDGCSEGICKEINSYASQIGYNVSSINTPNDGRTWHCNKAVGYCVAKADANSSGSTITEKNAYYFDVITQININIPIINKIMGLRIFQIRGSTKTMENLNMD